MLTEIQVLHWDLVYHQYFLILQSPSPGRGFASPNTDFPYLTRYYKDLQPIINQECLKDIKVDYILAKTYVPIKKSVNICFTLEKSRDYGKALPFLICSCTYQL